MSFVHLHTHSHYSLLDGLGTPKDIVRKAKEDGSPAIALTDHGVLYGAIEFYKEAKEKGIKPIIGCETYVAPNSRFDRTPGSENKPFHLVLLAKDKEGYSNLIKLISQSHLEGFYYKPRVDIGLLKAHCKGLIASSACLAGEVPRAILEGDEKRQLDVIGKYQDVFGKENFFLELQDHPFLDDQKIVNDRLIELSRKSGASLIATQDSHYINRDDRTAHDILLCVQTQTNLMDEGRMKLDGDFSLRSPEDMTKAFSNIPEAVSNTLKVADMCNIELDFNQNLIPVFKTPNSISAREYLERLCREGLEKKYGSNPPGHVMERLRYELDIVNRMGFNDYFLIVWDFVNYAKSIGITVGPGRGSAAGSLITYSLNITELDPIKHGLIFERFLNPERVSMPDIDVDFADNRRDEVLKYVVEKYGRQNVAQIITFGTMAARAAVRDVGRAMGYPYAEVDRIAKLVPPPVQGKHVPLVKSIEKDPELRSVYHNEERTKALLDNAIKLEGTVRHAGTHASAVVMSEQPLVNYTPLQRATGGGDEIITQYSMRPVEEIGLLKMDFLGLRNLTIIQKTLVILKHKRGLDLDMSIIPIDDEATFDLLRKADTTGVFQLESAGMRRYIKELKPTSFEDIVAMISLYRPGPMEWIPGYIKAKHNPDTIRYLHASFESILKETNGVAIYQEQILQIARDFAGFSLGEADILRKAVGKKKASLLNEQKEKFITGAVSKGHGMKFAEEVFEKVIEPFAGYGFNKAHAACYAMVSYRTAYLKAHYPIEFMAALLSSDHDNTERVAMEIMECEEMGFKVLPPSVNESFSSFTVVDEKTIRFGLSAIKGLGEGTIKMIIDVRKEGIFRSLEEFLRRVPVKAMNKKAFEAMVSSGAFDEMGERRAILESFEDLMRFAKSAQEISAQGQTNIFADMDDDHATSSLKLKTVEPAGLIERLNWEKEYLGLYVSGHPLRGLKKYLSKKVNLIDGLTRRNVGRSVKLGGLLMKMKKVFTKSGSYMLYGELEDPTGRIELVVFPKVYAQYQQFFVEGNILIMEGRLDLRSGNLQFSANNAKSVSLDSMIGNAKAAGQYDEKEKIVRKTKVLEAEVKKDPIEEDLHLSTAEEEDWNENPFCIRVPAEADETSLLKLKTLLLRHPGERKAEMMIGSRTVKLPFAIKVSDELENGIKELFPVH